jgi:hypothetical protein
MKKAALAFSPRLTTASLSSTDPYKDKPFLLTGSIENAALARVAVLEEMDKIDVCDTVCSLTAACMFEKAVEQYEIDRINYPDAALVELCARMYLAGRESIFAAGC